MKLYIFIILFIVMIANVNSTFSAVSCSSVKQKNANTLCNIIGVKTSCSSNVSDSVCDKAFEKLTHLHWQKLSAKNDISSITVQGEGEITVNLKDGSDPYVFSPDTDYKEIGERLGVDTTSAVYKASNVIDRVQKESFGQSVPCNNSLRSTRSSTEKNRSEESFWTTLDEIHKDTYRSTPEKYFKDKAKMAEGTCTFIAYRMIKDGDYEWVKNSYSWEVDTSTSAQKARVICNKTINGKDWDAQVEPGIHFLSAYGLFNFSVDGKKWTLNYDYRNRDHDDSKKDNKTLFSTDGVKISGDNVALVSDDANGVGFPLKDIKTCEFTENENKALEAKIAQAKKENKDWKKITITSCRFEPDQMMKIREAWLSIQKRVISKCMNEVAPIVAGSTSTCNNPDSETGTCTDEKDLDSKNGIPGMTIKNCSNIEVEGKKYPHLYVVERFENGKRYAHGAATIENIDRSKGKKSATLVYNWEYDNANNAKFAQTGGSSKIPKTIQGESKLPVFIDDNDNVVSLKSRCFKHSYTRTSDGGKPISDGRAFYNRSGGGIEKLECVN